MPSGATAVPPANVNYLVTPSDTLTDYTVLVLPPEAGVLPTPAPDTHGFLVDPGIVHVASSAVAINRK